MRMVTVVNLFVVVLLSFAVGHQIGKHSADRWWANHLPKSVAVEQWGTPVENKVPYGPFLAPVYRPPLPTKALIRTKDDFIQTGSCPLTADVDTTAVTCNDDGTITSWGEKGGTVYKQGAPHNFYFNDIVAPVSHHECPKGQTLSWFLETNDEVRNSLKFICIAGN